MAETSKNAGKAPEVVKEEPVNTEVPATPEAQKEEQVKAKAEAKTISRAKKQVNLDKDMDRVRPTYATGIQALMRDLIAHKGKK